MREAMSVIDVQATVVSARPKTPPAVAQQGYDNVARHRPTVTRDMPVTGLAAGTHIAPYQPLAIGAQPNRAVASVFDAMNIAHFGQAEFEGAFIIIGNAFLVRAHPDGAILIFVERVDGIVGQRARIFGIIGQRNGAAIALDNLNAFLVLTQPNTSVFAFQHRPYGVERLIRPTKLFPLPMHKIVTSHPAFTIDPDAPGTSGIDGGGRYPPVIHQDFETVFPPLRLQGLPVQTIQHACGIHQQQASAIFGKRNHRIPFPQTESPENRYGLFRSRHIAEQLSGSGEINPKYLIGINIYHRRRAHDARPAHPRIVHTAESLRGRIIAGISFSGPYPQEAVPVLLNGKYEVVRQRSGIAWFAAVDPDVVTIIAVQPGGRGKPHIAVRILIYGIHLVVGQAVFHLQMLEHITLGIRRT